jgi:hypothetical protein
MAQETFEANAPAGSAGKVEAEETALLSPEEVQPAIVFGKKGALDPLLDRIKKWANSIVTDVSTARGRKEVASRAYRISQAKVVLDNAGKAYIKAEKDRIKAVDIDRKRARDTLVLLRDDIRRPLTEWEAAEAARKAEEAAAEAARIAAEQLAEAKNTAWGIALVENDLFDRTRAIEAKEAEMAKQREEAERKEREAELEARREVEEAERAAKQKAREEEIAREAAEKAKREAEEAAAAEKAEQEAVEAKRKADEERKAKNKQHRGKIEREALAGLRGTLDATMAGSVLELIKAEGVPHVTINY